MVVIYVWSLLKSSFADGAYSVLALKQVVVVILREPMKPKSCRKTAPGSIGRLGLPSLIVERLLIGVPRPPCAHIFEIIWHGYERSFLRQWSQTWHS